MKRIEFLLYAVMFVGVGFAGGWVASRHGPSVVDAPLGAVLQCALEHEHAVHVAPPPVMRPQPAPVLTPEDLLRADAERRGLEVGHWNTQLELLAEREKERRIRLAMLEGRGDPADADTLAALRDEVALIGEAREDVEARKDAALRELEQYGLVLDADAAIAAARVDG